MKKILFIACALFSLLSFTSCSEKTYSLRNPVDEIESIEIVFAENSLEFTVTKTLSEEEREAFFEQFQKIEFENYFLGDPMLVNGNSVKITYQNGDYEMICYRWAEYVKNGEIYFVRKHCDEKTFNELINSFLE
ncbi:MAG: hypothetical protein E7480_08510 [Ruminococcaceae bacterium]|nr:hypothetical protein [Oscillospiraceae bacterium]